MGKKEKKDKKTKEKKPKKDKKKEKNDSSVWEIESMTSHSETGDMSSATGLSDTDVELEKRDSLEELDERNEQEKKLFEFLENNDVSGMKAYFKENRSKINILQKDTEKMDLLTKACQAGNDKMIGLILKMDPDTINTNEALLVAIKTDNLPIVHKLLYFEDSRQKGPLAASAQRLLTDRKFKRKKALIDFDHGAFGHITPFALAASLGRYDIMQVLYNRGERLPQLHMPSCDCPECKKQTRSMERSEGRMCTLRAMSNPTYFIFMANQDGSFDPIKEAFAMKSIIDQCDKEEPEFSEAYQKILKKVTDFPVDLLDACRDMEETKTLLKQRDGYVGGDTPYPRLALAIQNDQFKFAAHPNAQYLMYQEWIDQAAWNPKTNAGLILKRMFLVFLVVFFPVINIILWFALFCCPSLPYVRFLLSPINRCISKLGSYLLFCYLLYCMNAERRADGELEPATLYIRWIIVLFVISHFVQLIRLFLLDPHGFFNNSWNWYDCFVIVLFGVTFGCWIWILLRVQSMGFEEVRIRKSLPKEDPLLISECFLSVASTLATIRLIRIILLHPGVGPHIMGVGYTIKGYRMYIVILFAGVVTFWTGVQILIRPYANETEVEDGKLIQQNTDLISIVDTAPLMFTESIDRAKMKLVKPSRQFERDGVVETVVNEQETTQHFLNIICVAFVVLFGFFGEVLTGFLSNTKAEVREGKGIHWRTLRVQEWIYYIRDSNLAPPFNLLPNGSCIVTVFSWLGAVVSKGENKEAGCDPYQCCYLRDVESPQEQEMNQRKYPELLRRLYMRYFRQMKNKAMVGQYARIQHVDRCKAQIKAIQDILQDKQRDADKTSRDMRGEKEHPVAPTATDTTVYMSPKPRNILSP